MRTALLFVHSYAIVVLSLTQSFILGASCTELVFTRTDAELQIGKSKIIFLLVIEFVKMIPDVENQLKWVCFQ